VSDHGLPVFTQEFAVYVGVGTVGFVALALLLADNQFQILIFFIGVLYGWFLIWLNILAEARAQARPGESSKEGVSP
jgi:hypothetical protein